MFTVFTFDIWDLFRLAMLGVLLLIGLIIAVNRWLEDRKKGLGK
jgi:hypothetical protein